MSDDWRSGVIPEQRLWCAVILSALEEYEDYLMRINQLWRETDRPVDSTYRRGLLAVKRELMHQNFTLVCELADIPFEQVKKKLDILDREYGLSQIPFDYSAAPPEPQLKRRLAN